MKAASANQRLSMVLPVYNETLILPEFHRWPTAVLGGIEGTCEVVYINDGSRDGTGVLLGQLHQDDPRVAVMSLTRNFGKEIVMAAGLDPHYPDEPLSCCSPWPIQI